jgi:5'-phosphate synthase pdxT subunit
MNGLEGKLIVAARQKLIMVTAFHPELTGDLRWHQLFLTMVNESRAT